MGNKESVVLSQKDVTLCANLAVQSHTDVDTIKLVLSEWKKKGGDAESKGLTSPQKLYGEGFLIFLFFISSSPLH